MLMNGISAAGQASEKPPPCPFRETSNSASTSRRRIFQDDYARAFDDADRALVYEVPDEPIYSATGEVTERFSSADLCEALGGRGIPADAFASVDAIIECVVREAQPGDVVLVMSNGGFDGIWEKLLAALRTSG